MVVTVALVAALDALVAVMQGVQIHAKQAVGRDAMDVEIHALVDASDVVAVEVVVEIVAGAAVEVVVEIAAGAAVEVPVIALLMVVHHVRVVIALLMVVHHVRDVLDHVLAHAVQGVLDVLDHVLAHVVQGVPLSQLQ